MENEWISTKDRLPAERTHVLIGWAGSTTIEKAYLVNDHGLQGWWNSTNSFRIPDFWQPLPDPPPKPDPFEEWIRDRHWAVNREHLAFARKDMPGAIDTIPVKVARTIWDAAIASTKGTP